MEALDRGRRASPTDAMRAAAELLEARRNAASDGASVSPSRIARLFANAGDKPKAIAWLERALEGRRPAALHTFADPSLDPFRNSPEFRELQERLGLP